MIALTSGQWALMCLAAFLIGVSKTGIAGINILAIAIFASVLPARESVGAVLIAFLGGDLVAVLSYRHDAHWQHLWRLFPWAGLGVVIGALAIGRIPDAGVRRLIGGILLALIVFYLLRQYAARNGEAELIPFTRHPWLIGLTGVLAGFTTMVANASGPIMVLYLLALRLPKVAFIGTAAWFFLFLNLFKLPFSAGLGLINAASLPVGLRLAPFAVAGALLGKPILRHVDQKLFERLALVLTLVAAVRLLLQDLLTRYPSEHFLKRVALTFGSSPFNECVYREETTQGETVSNIKHRISAYMRLRGTMPGLPPRKKPTFAAAGCSCGRCGAKIGHVCAKLGA